MKHFFAIVFIVFFNSSFSQELFPNTEPASTMPKGVLGIRAILEDYKEFSQSRNQFSLRLMYGITSRWSFYAQPMVSNHHGDLLPLGFLTHTHVGNSTIFNAANIYGLQYPYTFSGIYFYSKYRLLNFDGDDRHFRVSVYGEYAYSKVAHDEAEPDLQGDNGGYGAGVILTGLKGRLAVSFTGGFIIPNSYSESRTEPYYGSYIFQTSLNYGNAIKYDLSFGYLLYPSKYESYDQSNINTYMEFIGRSYGAASVTQNGEKAEIKSPALQAGNYVEVRPGIQKIFNSNARLDLSVGLNLINRSWSHFTPLFMIGWQRYFFSLPKKTSRRPIIE